MFLLGDAAELNPDSDGCSLSDLHIPAMRVSDIGHLKPVFKPSYFDDNWLFAGLIAFLNGLASSCLSRALPVSRRSDKSYVIYRDATTDFLDSVAQFDRSHRDQSGVKRLSLMHAVRTATVQFMIATVYHVYTSVPAVW